MHSQNAANAISGVQILKIFGVACPPTPLKNSCLRHSPPQNFGKFPPLIGTIIKRKAKAQQLPTSLIRTNKTFSNTYDIANEFNEHFVNVGQSLASKIPSVNGNPTSLIDNSPTSSFVMSPVLPSKVIKLLMI